MDGGKAFTALLPSFVGTVLLHGLGQEEDVIRTETSVPAGAEGKIGLWNSGPDLTVPSRNSISRP